MILSGGLGWIIGATEWRQVGTPTIPIEVELSTLALTSIHARIPTRSALTKALTRLVDSFSLSSSSAPI